MRQHGEEDRGAREDGPVRGEVEVVLGVVEDAAPGRDVGREAEAEERQRRLGDDRGGHVDGARHDDGAQGVRQDVADDLAQGRAPRLRAASTNSFSRRDRNWARTSRATGIQRKPPMTDDDQDEDARLGPERLLQGVAEQVDDEEQQRELGQRQEQIGDPHQRVVHRAARRGPRPRRRRCPTLMAMSMAATPTASEMRPP